MYEKIIEKTMHFIFKYGNVKEEDRDIYQYGLEITLIFILNICTILIISLFLNLFIESLLFLVCFSLLQSFAGGYHAMTHLRCFLMTMACWVIAVVSVPLIEPFLILHIVFSAASLIMVFLLAPIQHKNYPMSDEKARRMKKIARTIVVMQCAVVLAIEIFNPALSVTASAISVTQLLSAISILYAAMKNKKLKTKLTDELSNGGMYED